MEPVETVQRAKAAEAKLARGEKISREERLAMLASLLATQNTRKDGKYGQA